MKIVLRIQFVIISLLLFGFSVSQGQDIHFSQFYASPLTLNPALTGVNKCDIRFTANYRNQWASITTPYKTASISYDSKFMADQIFGRDYLGGGLVVVTDQSGTGALSVFKVMLSGAYHREIGNSGKHSAGIGLQGSFVQKKVDLSKFRWPSQYPDYSFNSSTPSGEVNLQDNLSYAELSVGLLHTFKQEDQYMVQSGISIFHLNGPKESFLGEDSKLSPRIVIHTGGRIKTGDRTAVIPNFFYMTQSKAPDFNVGGAFEYTLSPSNLPDDLILSFGSWFRVGDAIMLVPAAEYKNWRLGFSYDLNISDLKEVSNYKGGFEISLIWNLCKPTKAPVGPFIIPCRVF